MLAELQQQLDVLQQAADALEGCQALSSVMLLALEVGNYMNGGTRKGGAYGFRLKTLDKMTNLRANDNSATFMTFIVQEVMRPSRLYVPPKHGCSQLCAQ